MGQPQQVYDKERISLNIARLKKGGETFEVIIDDTDKALELHQGQTGLGIRDIINGDLVFKDAKKGMAASEHLMKKWLGTEDHFEAAKKIIKNGEFHLTAEQRNKLYESRRRKIIEYIHQNAADPKSGLPHPVARIELAMKEAKVQIDPTDKLDWIIPKVIDQLRPLLPLSFDKARIKVTIPARYAGSAYSVLKSKHTLKSENWRNDGAVQFEMDTVAGAKSDLFSLIGKLTNGEADIMELK